MYGCALCDCVCVRIHIFVCMHVRISMCELQLRMGIYILYL